MKFSWLHIHHKKCIEVPTCTKKVISITEFAILTIFKNKKKLRMEAKSDKNSILTR